MPRVRTSILLACGWTSLGLGVVGLAVPILPTVPFVLLAAACFVRSSERCHRWLVTHPVFGRHIADYLAGRGIARRAKILALATLWASVLLSVVLFVPLLAADVAMVAVAAAVTIYIVRLPTAGASGSAPEDPPATCEQGQRSARPMNAASAGATLLQ